jgi:hypothetical protein
MLDRLILDLLYIICKSLNNKDILMLAMTCRRLYEICRVTERIWHEKMKFNYEFMSKSIGGKYVKDVVISIKCDWVRAMEFLRDKKINSLMAECGYTKESEEERYEQVKKIPYMISPWLKYLELIGKEMGVVTIATFLENNMLEVLKLQLCKVITNETIVIDEVGRNYKCIIISKLGKYNKFDNPKIRDDIEGLQAISLKFSICMIGAIRNAKNLCYIHMNDEACKVNCVPDLLNEKYKLTIAYICAPKRGYYAQSNEIKRSIEIKVLYCGIEGICDDTFVGMTNLRILYLNIESWMEIDFSKLVRLTQLTIDGKLINFDDLYCLKNLVILRLYTKVIKFVHDNLDAFVDVVGLPKGFNAKTFPKLKILGYKIDLWRYSHKDHGHLKLKQIKELS